MVAASLICIAFSPLSPLFLLPLPITLALSLLGYYDLVQRTHSILRNYPISAHLRFLLESIRPEIRQYFLEGETDGTPFSRNKRSIVYQRAKGQLDKRPFGTQLDVYADSFEWLHHSIAPKEPAKEPFRISIGGGAVFQALCRVGPKYFCDEFWGSQRQCHSGPQ